MRKILIFTIMVFIATSVLAADVFRGEEQPEFLMVISAPAGTFNGGVLTLKGVSTVVYFSDRPERIAGHMTVSDFVALWDGGEDGFSSDPPNATLSVLGDGGVNDVVVVLRDADMMGDSVTFTVDILEGESPAEFGAASLFIDAFPTAVNSQITD